MEDKPGRSSIAGAPIARQLPGLAIDGSLSALRAPNGHKTMAEPGPSSTATTTTPLPSRPQALAGPPALPAASPASRSSASATWPPLPGEAQDRRTHSFRHIVSDLERIAIRIGKVYRLTLPVILRPGEINA